MDHRKDFQWLVLERLGKEQASVVDWTAPRLICIAGDFNRYDDHAVKQIQRNIELIRYRRFGTSLLMLDLVIARTETKSLITTSPEKRLASTSASNTSNKYKSITTILAELDTAMVDRFESLRSYLLALGDDVQETTLLYYFAFKRIKNFACVEFRPSNSKILVFVKVDPDSIAIEAGFTRDVRKIGHFGTGDLEISLSVPGDLERAKPLIKQSYDKS
jgi:predicted transport protein